MNAPVGHAVPAGPLGGTRTATAALTVLRSQRVPPRPDRHIPDLSDLIATEDRLAGRLDAVLVLLEKGDPLQPFIENLGAEADDAARLIRLVDALKHNWG